MVGSFIDDKEKINDIFKLSKDEFIYPYSHTKSCGCWHREESSKRPRNTKNGKYIKINKEAN